MIDRKKLIDMLMDSPGLVALNDDWGRNADYLLANGVTVQKWIPVTERLPEPFVSVLVQMPGEKPFPTVREGFLSSNGIWHSALYDREPDEVTHWMPMPQPPEDGGAENA